MIQKIKNKINELLALQVLKSNCLFKKQILLNNNKIWWKNGKAQKIYLKFKVNKYRNNCKISIAMEISALFINYSLNLNNNKNISDHKVKSLLKKKKFLMKIKNNIWEKINKKWYFLQVRLHTNRIQKIQSNISKIIIIKKLMICIILII